jgi:hypothetical protein
MVFDYRIACAELSLRQECLLRGIYDFRIRGWHNGGSHKSNAFYGCAGFNCMPGCWRGDKSLPGGNADTGNDLAYVPKIVACFVALVAALPWMINLIINFTHNLFSNIPNYVK